MQGGLSSKEKINADYFWQNSGGQQPITDLENANVKVECVRELAHTLWDKIQDYKDSIITVYEVEETFPAIFFLQEIKQNVFDVKINCIQDATEKIK